MDLHAAGGPACLQSGHGRRLESWQDRIGELHDSGWVAPRYLVLGSRFQGQFSLGGDLALFARCIRSRDRASLVSYGNACVRILHRNMLSLNRPIVTIALVQGDALGGGFEALLSFNVIVAERGSRFGLPETSFGLFPGMGAHCFLSRRLGAARAENMILSGRAYSAEEMFDLGLVHVIAEPGQGRAAVEDYIRLQGTPAQRPLRHLPRHPRGQSHLPRGAGGGGRAMGRRRARTSGARPETDAAAGQRADASVSTALSGATAGGCSSWRWIAWISSEKLIGLPTTSSIPSAR